MGHGDHFDDPPIVEMIDGERIEQRRTIRQLIASTQILIAILRLHDTTWVALPNKPVQLGANVLVPALCGWRRQTSAPDWVCEVLSPATTWANRRKLRIYARAGVGHLWLVDPSRRRLESMRLKQWPAWRLRPWARLRGHAEPFAGLDLDVGALWAADGELSAKFEQTGEGLETELALFFARLRADRC